MFIDPNNFQFTVTLEDNWKQILQELSNLDEESFQPWIQKQMYEQGWTIYPLFAFGEAVTVGSVKCPITAEIIRNIPGLSLAGFSRLSARTHVKPHVGWAHTVYRLHLGLVVPEQCSLRVGNETREWYEGKCLIFDDTVEHEAWNNSDYDRTVLLIDFLRPGVKSVNDEYMPEEVRMLANKLLKQR
ncbi:MAG: aspartyl/asparaginyl beta-hydroxylase domain-containing protein [Acidobacteriota bacterium]